VAVVRIEALRKLGKAIECAIPELTGKICYGQAAANHTLEFPSLVIDPRRWKYHPDQAAEVFEPSPNTVVMNVGRHEADIEIRVGHKTLFQRYELEQKLLDLFLGTPGHPGILLTQITACEALGQWLAAWELEADEWRDERAFDQQFYSLIAITGIIPALVTRREVHTIEQLQLGLDLSGPDSTLPITSPLVEVVQINPDGTISPA
jgi:hypothetical protein